MYHSRSVAGILVCVLCLLAACGSHPSTPAETSQPQGTVVWVPAAGKDPTPATPPAMPTEVLQSPLPTATVPLTPPAEGEGTQPLSPLPLPAKPDPSGERGAVTGEVPEDLLQSILDDLEERKGIGREEITIQRAEAVVWRDGSLGCPQPGMMYLQVLTPGYLVVLEVGDDMYNYHAAQSGQFVLCERSLPGEVLPLEGGADPLL